LLGLNDLFQPEEFLSVEFAPSSLKVARAQPDGSSLSVDYVDRESVDPDGSDRVEKYTRALTTLRERRSFAGINQVAFSLPTSGIIVRPLELPSVSDDRLDRAVRYEVEDKDSEIPFSPGDVVMDYEVVERTEKETRVVLAVVAVVPSPPSSLHPATVADIAAPAAARNRLRGVELPSAIPIGFPDWMEKSLPLRRRGEKSPGTHLDAANAGSRDDGSRGRSSRRERWPRGRTRALRDELEFNFGAFISTRTTT